MKRLPRILQIVWMIISAVCAFEAFNIFKSNQADKTNGYLFAGIGVFAFVRYVMLRRRQFMDKKKDDKFN